MQKQQQMQGIKDELSLLIQFSNKTKNASFYGADARIRLQLALEWWCDSMEHCGFEPTPVKPRPMLEVSNPAEHLQRMALERADIVYGYIVNIKGEVHIHQLNGLYKAWEYLKEAAWLFRIDYQQLQTSKIRTNGSK